jgi:hypothetical protein
MRAKYFTGGCSPDDRRRGASAIELALATAVVVIIGMGLYFLGQRSAVRLHHYVSTMTGAPYQ